MPRLNLALSDPKKLFLHKLIDIKIFFTRSSKVTCLGAPEVDLAIN